MAGERYRIRLEPIGTEHEVTAGEPLRNLLFEQGVEFPCGGYGRCRGCRIRILAGTASICPEMRAKLTDAELADGWRLACHLKAESDLTLELRQWDASILANEAEFRFQPQEGLGIAIDLGTTTLVAQLLNLTTGLVLGVKTALNPQARFGGDVMSRVEHACHGGAEELGQVIRTELGGLIQKLFRVSGEDPARLRRVLLSGNTVMHHLFCGIDVEPLSHYPFEPVNDGLQFFGPDTLGWELPSSVQIAFLPCLGGFVGSDILAGILASGILDSNKLTCLIDLGTNGEIVLGTRDKFICASTAAGPAFEGARIEMGMRAATGAIYKVDISEDQDLVCEALGGVEPVGICGSGLVDAVAAALNVGIIKSTGRISQKRQEFVLADPVKLTQTDIRQLQLAKGAIAAGVQILLKKMDKTEGDVDQIYLAGAFGNYVRLSSAIRIGLLGFPEERIVPSGNTSLLGTKMALFEVDPKAWEYTELRSRVEHFSLSADPLFQDIYVNEMSFPED